MSSVGDMLRLARQRVGMTQKAAAAHLGLAQPVLSRFENSASDPDAAVLEAAAGLYDVPREFFDLREPVYGPPVSVHPMLRAKADVPARDIDMVTAELNIRVMHLGKFLEAVDFEPTLTLPSLDIEQYSSAEEIASIVRHHWALPEGPVRNLTALVEKAGVVIGLSDFRGASISGMTFKVPGKPPLVLLNELHSADRLRLTLAHELGHLVMHKFPTPTMEDEAFTFAAAFLMPAADFRSALFGRKVNLELLAALKPEWRVSMQALLVRARALNIIDANQSRYLWQTISARGWRLREPPELDFAPDRPALLNSMIKMHLENLGYTMSDLCGMVPLHERTFRELYEMPDDVPKRPKLRLVT